MTLAPVPPSQAAKKLQSAERKKLGNLSESAMLNVFMSADADSNGTISHTELIGLVRESNCCAPYHCGQTVDRPNPSITSD